MLHRFSQSIGRVSEHALISWPLNGESDRVLKRLGVGRGLSQAEAALFRAEHKSYVETLSEHGVLVTAGVEWDIVHIEGEWQIWFTGEWVPGSSGSELLHAVGWTAMPGLLKDAISIVDKLGSGYGKMHCGVDLKPSNLVLSGAACFLVDSFPPLNLIDGNLPDHLLNTKLHKFSREKLEYVCCTQVGMLSRFIRLAELEISHEGCDDHEIRNALTGWGAYGRETYRLWQMGFPNLTNFYPDV